jgi:serine/threonine-protein kinase
LRPADGDATQTGFIALTPEYAAPEQLRGLPVTTATDTYALGVLLYLLLTGRRPYDVRGHPPSEVEHIVCEVEPPRPSDVAPETLRRRLRGDLDVIVMKALHKDPARRYSSAFALRDDLRRYRTGLPVLARPDSAAYRLRKFVRRRNAVGATAITLGALVAATVFSTSQAREAQRQRDAALREVERQRSMVEVQTVLASDPRDTNGRLLSPIQRIELAADVLSRQFAAQPWLIVEGMAGLAGRLYEIGDRDAERSMLARARAIARESHLATELALVSCAIAYSWSFDDQIDSARSALTEARQALARSGARDDATTAGCLSAQGQLFLSADAPDSAIASFKRALDFAGTGRNASVRQETLVGLATALRATGRTREATTYQRQVLLELDSAGYRGTDLLPNVIGLLNAALSELGEIATADSIIRAALAAQARLPSGYASGLLDFFHGLALLRMGELDSADFWLSRSMRHRTEQTEGLASYLPPAMTQLRLEQGRVPEARAALATLPSGTLIRRVNRAWFTAGVRYAEGDVRGASALLADSLRAIAAGSERLPPPFAMPLVTLAEWRLVAGDARAADSLAALGRTAAALDSIALERSAHVGRAELVRARALRSLGNASDARSAATRAVTALSNGYGPLNRHTSEARGLLAAMSQ